MEYNKERVEEIADNIIGIIGLCRENRRIWESDKVRMMKMIEMNYNEFYEKYPRICMTIVREEDISPLIGMLRAFSKVQNREITVEKANESITSALNATYINPALNSEKLVRERERKIREEREG